MLYLFKLYCHLCVFCTGYSVYGVSIPHTRGWLPGFTVMHYTLIMAITCSVMNTSFHSFALYRYLLYKENLIYVLQCLRRHALCHLSLNSPSPDVFVSPKSYIWSVWIGILITASPSWPCFHTWELFSNSKSALHPCNIKGCSSWLAEKKTKTVPRDFSLPDKTLGLIATPGAEKIDWLDLCDEWLLHRPTVLSAFLLHSGEQNQLQTIDIFSGKSPNQFHRLLFCDRWKNSWA